MLWILWIFFKGEAENGGGAESPWALQNHLLANHNHPRASHYTSLSLRNSYSYMTFKTNWLCILVNFLFTLRFFEKKFFCGWKSHIFVFGDKNAVLGVRVAEARRCSLEAWGWLWLAVGGNFDIYRLFEPRCNWGIWFWKVNCMLTVTYYDYLGTGYR